MSFLHTNVFHHKNINVNLFTYVVYKLSEVITIKLKCQSVFCKTDQLPIIKVPNTISVLGIYAIFKRHLSSKWNEFYFPIILYFDNISDIGEGLMRLKVVNQTFKDCQNS